ncbi:MAG: O-antigen ligase family protein [Candidatus Promineifilaceae bacterium]
MVDSSLRRLVISNQPRLRLALIFGPVLVVLIAGAILSWPQPMYILAMMGAFVGALIFLRWPVLGILFLVASTTVIPWLINTGTKTYLNLTVLLVPALLGLWVFDYVARRRSFHLYFSSSIFAAFGLAIAATISFLLGQLPWFSLAPAPLTAQLGGLAIFMFSVGAFLLAVHHIEGQVWLERMVWLFLLLATFQMVANMMPNILPVKVIFHPLNSSLVLTWLMALAYSMAVFNRRLNVVWRIVLFFTVLLALYLTVFRLRSWASGWMPGMVSLFVITWAWKPRLGMIMGIVGGGFALLYFRDIIGEVILQDNIYSLDTRVAAWRILVEMIHVNPFLGLGPANYYWYTPLYSILGYNVQFNSHNQYVDLVAQVGLVGTAFFAWWAYAVARIGWRLRDVVSVGFEKAFVYAAIGGLAGTLFAGMLGDWVIPFVYNVGLNGFRGSVIAWLMLGGLVALERIYKKKEQPEPIIGTT